MPTRRERALSILNGVEAGTLAPADALDDLVALLDQSSDSRRVDRLFEYLQPEVSSIFAGSPTVDSATRDLSVFLNNNRVPLYEALLGVPAATFVAKLEAAILASLIFADGNPRAVKESEARELAGRIGGFFRGEPIER